MSQNIKICHIKNKSEKVETIENFPLVLEIKTPVSQETQIDNVKLLSTKTLIYIVFQTQGCPGGSAG